MKKVFLILTAFALVFWAIPAVHAEPMVKLDVANGLLKLSADPNVKIPIKAKYSEVQGKPVLKLDLRGGVGLKGIVNARVTVNGQEVSAKNVDQVGSKLVVTLDKSLLHAGSANKIVIDLGIKIAKLNVVKLQICLNLSADVMLQAKNGEVTLELTGCKDTGDNPGNGDNGNNDDDNNGDDGNNKGDDGTNDDNGNNNGDDGTNNGDNGNNNGGNNGGDNGNNADNGGDKGVDNGKEGSLPNHNSGGQLPKTATPYPTLSLIGALLLLTGAGLLRLKVLRG